MRPAYLGEAALGARITFELPATVDTVDAFTGRVTAWERHRHAAGFPFIRFSLDSTGERTFNCRADLHITIEETR